jgi:Protein of unknown function (DUF3168)
MKKSELLREAASLLNRHCPFAYDEIEAVQEAYDNEVAREMRERNYEPITADHMINPGFSVQQAICNALASRTSLVTLLGGAQIFDKLPQHAAAPYVVVSILESRDWTICDKTAHEHFIAIETKTNSFTHEGAQRIAHEIEWALDNAALSLVDHKLFTLRIIFTILKRDEKTRNYNIIQRFRAATEPLPEAAAHGTSEPPSTPLEELK